MNDQRQGYSRNRRRGIETARIITELPVTLIDQVDRWGVAAGMKSRREAAETLLNEGLKAAGGKLGGEAPAAGSENAA